MLPVLQFLWCGANFECIQRVLWERNSIPKCLLYLPLKIDQSAEYGKSERDLECAEVFSKRNKKGIFQKLTHALAMPCRLVLTGSICWWCELQGGGGGGYSSEFLVGVCGSVPRTMALFQTKLCNFLVPFFRPGLKIRTYFQTYRPKWLKAILHRS